MGMANPKRSQEKPRDQRPRRDPRWLTSRELPRLRLHETSQEASLLLVSGEPRKVGREGRRALDPEPEDIVKARRLRRLAGQVGCGRLQSARTASPPKRGVEWRSSERLWLSVRAGARHRALGGRERAGESCSPCSPCKGRGGLCRTRSRIPSGGQCSRPWCGAHTPPRPPRTRGGLRSTPSRSGRARRWACLSSRLPNASFPRSKNFRRQTFLKERGDLSPRHRNNAR